MNRSLLRLDLAQDRDIVAARQRARQVSALLGFDSQDQVRIATAVSELARNAIRHAGGGTIEFMLTEAPSPGAPIANPLLQIIISDHGPGIANLDDAIADSGIGELKLGLVAARRMMDTFDVYSGRGRGTTITLGKFLPRRTDSFSAARAATIADQLSTDSTDDPTAEIQQQNRELLRSLEELRLRKEELARLNSELEDTNRGVMALYAELEERAAHLRLADETKTRFLSAVSHEFRTPVNSILALSKILLHRLDGELTSEQEKQVTYIRQAAEQLATMVDDLLDLRKVESGKLQLRVESFNVTDLFGALRGMFKPLSIKDTVSLSFEEIGALPELHTDQGKVSQILRNLISNALKFTEAGAVRVTAKLAADTDMIVFSVADTGIGIAPENHRRIFDEFTQVENPLQTTVKGTGLGLPLSQRLAGLLGGSIDIASELGKGSVLSLAIPIRLEASAPLGTPALPAARTAQRVLIVDDSEVERYALRQFLPSSTFEVIEASGGYDGLRLARQSHPDLIFLDLAMPDVHGLEVLKMLKAIDETRHIPVVLFTSQRPDDIGEEQAAAASGLLLKSELSRESVAAAIRRAGSSGEIHHAGHA
ncbi:sensor histidine kinase [Steroidobacter agaridevorans]|uniref:histidine kinase n=1 Tax=Steroidobacter agaridevorans TaxID=2695856 RepID=A0A829YFU0_9GAMM|nr:ATP-binding protein [Steroidobacter agaridevorans]GFE81456.1 sensor histidine kinase [Steroidobacter agaridevorans]GFE88662.1 sensor histidine kinase [Steroidobacter agaridevorans]